MDLLDLNKTELLELIRQQTGVRLSPNSTIEELVETINTGHILSSSAVESGRRKLQLFITDNWEFFQTNLPCRGQINEGKCTIFKCPNSRFINCYQNVKEHLKE